MEQIKFGTDGWRGVIARDFTFENVRLVSQAISEWIKHDLPQPDGRKTVVVGFDTRFLSDAFAQEVACVLAANDIRVVLSQRAVPTPVVSFAVKDRKLDAGIMITASHNLAQFNGIKIKTSDGGAAPKSVTEKVEGYLGRSPVVIADFASAQQDGRIGVSDLSREYLIFIKKYLDFKRFKPARFRVLLDVMHGSGNGYAEQILKGTGIKLELMRAGINPSFEGRHPEPIEENIPHLLQRMKKERFALGLVLDGDADRIAAVMPGGEFVSPQKILGLLALHLFQDRGMRGAVVKTLPGTVLVDHICKDLGLPLYETPVGFKYISELMTSKDVLVGGEEAGGMGLKNYIPERDGILAGLLLLEMMIYRRKNIAAIVREMENKYGRFYYLRADLKTAGQPIDLAAIKGLKELLGKRVTGVDDSDGVKIVCDDESWLMLRVSGTEPLVRVYAEADSLRRAKALLAFGEKFVKGR
ncbi:MAG: phosphoglucomutase/phosphomannomutase family protein [Candidatus Omnitrophota bacterium]